MSSVPIPDKTLEQYRSYKMLWERMQGATTPWLAHRYEVSNSTVLRRVKKTFIEIQIMLMENTQADPNHPAEPWFTLEEFNKDPQACREKILKRQIEKLEATYPELREGKQNGATN